MKRLEAPFIWSVALLSCIAVWVAVAVVVGRAAGQVDQSGRISQVERNLDLVAAGDSADLERHEIWLESLEQRASHRCIAPCVVSLPTGALEDQFGLDYTFEGRKPVVRIWRGQQ